MVREECCEGEVWCGWDVVRGGVVRVRCGEGGVL